MLRAGGLGGFPGPDVIVDGEVFVLGNDFIGDYNPDANSDDEDLGDDILHDLQPDDGD